MPNTQQLILIVDDEPDIRELLEITLSRMGKETISAENITSATQLLAENDIDLCLTDMKLPDGNGIDLVKHINTDYPDLPVAMITAHGNVDTAVDAMKQGATDFVAKPWQNEKVVATISAALKLRQSREETETLRQTNEVLMREAAPGDRDIIGESPQLQ